MQNEWKVHTSKIDESVNFTKNTSDGGMLECRFVRRSSEYFIIYLSSHTGCKHACRFCHLTQSKQTMFREATLVELLEQFNLVLNYAKDAGIVYDLDVYKIHINFMARGDALSSHVITTHWKIFADEVIGIAAQNTLDVVFNISTIFPQDSKEVNLVSTFGLYNVMFYWSIYSVEEKFRKRWLPYAQGVNEIVQRLEHWQAKTNQEIVFHGAFILEENDSKEDVDNLLTFLNSTNLYGRFNIVRYNSYKDKTGKETSQNRLYEIKQKLNENMKVFGTRIVPRVGQDVKASCGMFLE